MKFVFSVAQDVPKDVLLMSGRVIMTIRATRVYVTDAEKVLDYSSSVALHIGKTSLLAVFREREGQLAAE